MLCKNNFSNTQKVKEYKTYSNKLSKIKKKLKKSYFEKRLQNCNKSSADTWKVINEITNRQKKSYEFPQKLKLIKNTYVIHFEIVNSLNLYSLQILENKNCLNSISFQNSFINSPRSYYKSFVCFEIHEKEISDIIKSLNSNKANGADNISKC